MRPEWPEVYYAQEYGHSDLVLIISLFCTMNFETGALAFVYGFRVSTDETN